MQCYSCGDTSKRNPPLVVDVGGLILVVWEGLILSALCSYPHMCTDNAHSCSSASTLVRLIMSKNARPRQQREQHLARGLAAIKQEIKLLLGTLDPISAFNYLHNEGIVSQSEKEDFERDVSSYEKEVEPRSRRHAVSVYSKDSVPSKPRKASQKVEQAARQKLAEIVEKRKDHNELRSAVTALNAYKKLHQAAKQRRVSQPDGEQSIAG